MHRVVQTRVGETGNCFAACLASILDLPLEAVPEMSTDDQAERANDFLAGYGLSYRRAFIDGKKPSGYSTIEGVSPRGGMHACVALDGELLWDPHPIEDGTGQGLVEPRYYGLLESILGVTGKELKKHKSLGLDALSHKDFADSGVPKGYTKATWAAHIEKCRAAAKKRRELLPKKPAKDQAGTMTQLRKKAMKEGPFFIQETTESGAERTIPVKNLRRY